MSIAFIFLNHRIILNSMIRIDFFKVLLYLWNVKIIAKTLENEFVKIHHSFINWNESKKTILSTLQNFIMIFF